MSDEIDRCEVTGNPCGTDTRPADQPCDCETCRHYWGTEEDWAEIEKMAPTGDEIRRIAEYLKETGQAYGDE